MASFDYRLNPLYAIKECSSCGTLYTGDCGCSKGSLEDKILVSQTNKKEEEKRIEEEQAAKARYWKIPVCYDDDDDEERSIPLKDNIISRLPPCVAITTALSTLCYMITLRSRLMEEFIILKILSRLSLQLKYPVEDSDSLREEIDILLDWLNDSIPPGIESDDFDSEDDDNSTFLPEFESFHVDYPEYQEINLLDRWWKTSH
ncbi:hypothetical protein Tco_1509151 [Tanacetum coccineum]|uniref:Uncharacterized protein n=1 Tax=Tanacetum coccineum TaxID=301880 RepID=A0ABQ4Y3W2_9ASTR